MFWSSVLPVTIFVLANTVCVSLSASTGRQRFLNMQPETEEVIPQQLEDEEVQFQPEFISAEATVPELVNAHSRKDLDDELMDSAPISSNFRFRYDDDLGAESSIRNPVKPLYFHRLAIPKYEETPQNLHGAAAHRFHYLVKGAGVGGYKTDIAASLPQDIAKDPATVMWPMRPNYSIPAEGFITGRSFDKRSPRCIAKCMQQGLVHPLQCHSLC